MTGNAATGLALARGTCVIPAGATAITITTNVRPEDYVALRAGDGARFMSVECQEGRFVIRTWPAPDADAIVDWRAFAAAAP